MHHEQLVKPILQSNTKMNLHNDDDNVDDSDMHNTGEIIQTEINAINIFKLNMFVI